MRFDIYTDGACSGNPGPGGYAAVITNDTGIVYRMGMDKDTTSNRMELAATIEALDYMIAVGRNYDIVVVHSDSNYVVNTINNNLLLKWAVNGYVNGLGLPIKNKDLWKKVQARIEMLNWHDVCWSVTKVKAHSGNTFNEKADELAKEMVEQAKLLDWDEN